MKSLFANLAVLAALSNSVMAYPLFRRATTTIETVSFLENAVLETDSVEAESSTTFTVGLPYVTVINGKTTYSTQYSAEQSSASTTVNNDGVTRVSNSVATSALSVDYSTPVDITTVYSTSTSSIESSQVSTTLIPISTSTGTKITETLTDAKTSVLTTASTSTTTLFSATSTPSTSVTGSAAASVTTTMSNPLNTDPVVSSSLQTTLTSSTFSKGTTLTATTTTVPETQLVQVSQVVDVTSETIISSEAVIYPNTSFTLTSTKVTTSTSISKSTIVTLSTSTSLSTYDLFAPVATDAPPAIFSRAELPLEILDGVSNDDKPFQTNKFYANLILDNQDLMVWTYPYGLWKSTSSYYGFAVSQTDSSQRVFGSTNELGASSYFYNPIDIASFVFSSTSFSSSNMKMEVTEMKEMSALVTLVDSDLDTSENFIDINLVQGMGFVTAVYNGELVPLLNSQVGFKTITKESSTALGQGIIKYSAVLFNDVEWFIYVTLPDGYTTDDFEFQTSDSYNLAGSKAIDGLIVQVAKASTSSSSTNTFYDEAAGMYVSSASVQGSTDGSIASYQFVYETEGKSSSGEPLIFALPHHLSQFTAETSNSATGISLDSTTKGTMYAYLTSVFKFSADLTLTSSISNLPWSQQLGSNKLEYTNDQLQLLAKVANEDLSVDMTEQVKGISNYYGGKIIDKFAYILTVVNDILDDDTVSSETLVQIKKAFDVYLTNEQLYPLIYDTKFGGVTSSASLGGDTSLDFGASYYNDHHFHYGYFIHAAAVIGKIDAEFGGDWAQTHKDWVNSLIRDVLNPSESDSYFPVSRMFDWYHGHSWAAGLFSSSDGKNEESSSEDYNFAFGMKLWGELINDESMTSRANLMLSLMKSSMQSYFLYEDDNTVEPDSFIGNKVSGILFDNKIDHTTWFGTNLEYIQGIHMLPITPISSAIRTPTFVQQEWDEVLASRIDDINSGWTGILRLNQALFDPQTSYDFFAQDNFSSSWLDNGQSRTWCLAFSGGLANSV